jgi:ABC-type sugar transport system substrate-binding protein
VNFPVHDFYLVKAMDDGFLERMKDCSGCTVYTSRIPADLLGPGLQEKVEQALLQHPDANAAVFAYDDLLTAGGAAAIRSSGRNDQLNVIAGTGFKTNLDMIRKNQGQDAGYGYPYDLESWAGVDLMNRVFAGAKSTPNGIGVQIYDREHMPDGDTYKAPFDFRAAYRKSWGV